LADVGGVPGGWGPDAGGGLQCLPRILGLRGASQAESNHRPRHFFVEIFILSMLISNITFLLIILLFKNFFRMIALAISYAFLCC
jgi:hypothetical protein